VIAMPDSHARPRDMLVDDVMTHDVVTVRPGTLIASAVALMVDGRISGLPVVDDDGDLVGIVTEGDLLRRVELGTARHRPVWLSFLRGLHREAVEYVQAHTLRVADVMTPRPATVTPDATLDEVVTLMELRRVRRLPVVQMGRLVGIVSRGDLLRALGQAMATPPLGALDDAAIEQAILAAFAATDVFSQCDMRVSVTEGHVLLEGLVQSHVVRTAARVAAERVPGVVDVQNLVVVIDPTVSALGL